MRANFLPLVPGDADRVLLFMSRLYEQDVLPFDTDRARRVAEWLLANPDAGGIWLIEAEGADAGYLALTVCVSLEFHGRFALLDELYIDRPWRGLGIGGEAIEFAAQWARDRGLAAMRLEVAADNAHGQHVYRKCGFGRDERHIMTKWLS